MKCVHLHSSQIDKSSWNELVLNAPQGRPYHFAWYLDAMTTDWNALIFDDYKVILPLPIRFQFLGIKNSQTPSGIQQLGPLSNSPLSPVELSEVLQSIPRQYWKIGIRLNEGQFIESSGKFRIEKKVNQLTCLKDKAEDLLASFHKSNRKRLNKTQELYTLELNTQSPLELIAFYKKQLKDKFNLNRRMQFRYERLIRVSQEKNVGFINTLRDSSGQIVASGFFIRSHNRVYNLFGASRHEATGSMNQLIYQTMLQQRPQVDYFDFEGSNIPGVQKFFSQFNASMHNYYELHYNLFKN